MAANDKLTMSGVRFEPHLRLFVEDGMHRTDCLAQQTIVCGQPLPL